MLRIYYTCPRVALVAIRLLEDYEVADMVREVCAHCDRVESCVTGSIARRLAEVNK